MVTSPTVAPPRRRWLRDAFPPPAGVNAHLAHSNRFIMLDGPTAQKTLSLWPAMVFVLLVAICIAPLASAYLLVPTELRVYAAASLKDAIHDANVRYER